MAAAADDGAHEGVVAADEEEVQGLLTESSDPAPLKPLVVATAADGEAGSGGAGSGADAAGATAGPPKHPGAATERTVSSHVLGVILLVIVSIIWTAASVLSQHIFTDLKFPNAIFLTFVSNSLFIFWLPIESLRMKVAKDAERRGERTAPCCGWARRLESDRVPWAEVAKSAAAISLIWFAAQGCYNWSLAGSTVSVSTVLSTTSCVFTFILSVIWLRESFSVLTVVGVAATVLGAVVVMLASQDKDQGSNTWWGITLSVVSAASYGIYTVMIRRAVPEDSSKYSLAVLFGFIGLFNLISVAPIVMFLHFSAIEDLSGLTGYIFLLLVVRRL